MSFIKALLFFTAFSLLATGAHAEENSFLEKISILDESCARRNDTRYFILAEYAPLDLLIPNKIGLIAGLNDTAEKSWELEYVRGKFGVPFFIADLGSITDQRISLTKRSFFSYNSFNISYGITYFSFKAELGDKFLSSMTAHAPSDEIVGMESWGVHLGVGNRWTFKKNITLGIDWISWAQPLLRAGRQDSYLSHSSNEDNNDDVDKALNIVAYLPRISVLKIQLGMMF